jgi:hypothetical protein
VYENKGRGKVGSGWWVVGRMELRENTRGCGKKEGSNGDTVSRTLGQRLPHPLLFVKWEIKDCELNGLQRRKTVLPLGEELSTGRNVRRN